ncbi:MAG: tRNA (N(6)-L-threonylcarbamoyladenosine(37)-C(2))-methylthiotransferase MtaB, partial [Desulfobacterales bacterium]|nr:tRNA (N(6)-L-threonylcarbamoyladenosine(37)-C(2))-methylthiotransferase MtaB [Desulfobacterales bacterium]
MQKYIIKTLGCKVNQYESEAVAKSLKDSGFEATLDDEADICIINTCTVTGKASMQSRQAIRQAIRKNPSARIVVTGCYAQTEPEKLRQITGIHDIVANSRKYKISELVKHTGVNDSNSVELSNLDISREQDFFQSMSPVFGYRTRPFLKIQDGCNAFCSYCIVPFKRPQLWSLSIKDALLQTKKALILGFTEIIITGVNLEKYTPGLTNLVQSLLQKTSVPLISFGSVPINCID